MPDHPWRKVGDDLFCSTECFHCFTNKNYIASLEKKIKELEAKQAPRPEKEQASEPEPCLKCKKTDIGGVTSKFSDLFYCNNCFSVIEKTAYDWRFRSPDDKKCVSCKKPKFGYFIGSGNGSKYCIDCYLLTPRKPETVAPAAGYYNPETHVIVPRKELFRFPSGDYYIKKAAIASQHCDDTPAACPPESSGCDSTPAQKPQNHGCCCKADPPACPP